MAFISGGSLTDKLETANELTPANAAAVIAGLAPLDSYMDFVGRVGVGTPGIGTVLDSIPGYPDDLPRLQLFANSDLTNPRLCFAEMPVFTQNLKNWIDWEVAPSSAETMIGGRQLARPMLLVDWNPLQLYGTIQQMTLAEYNMEKAAYCVGRVYKALNDSTLPTVAKNRPATISDPIVNMVNPIVPGTQTVSALPVERLYWYGSHAYGWYWKAVRPWQWIFENVQWYINKYFKVPYVVTDLIPYGSNWVLQWQNATTGRKYNLITAYLSGCNFLIQPTGKMDFWDKFYLAVPILISTVAAIESGGAYAPALIAAVGAFVKKGEAQSQQTAANASNIEAAKDSTPNQNTSVIDFDIVTNGLFSSLSSVQLFGLLAVIIIIFILLYKNAK